MMQFEELHHYSYSNSRIRASAQRRGWKPICLAS